MFEPADALFCLDRHTGLVDLAFERQQPLELRTAPEAGSRQAEGEPFKRDGETGMHHHAIQLALTPAAFLVATAVHILGVADAIWCRSLVDEFCGVCSTSRVPSQLAARRAVAWKWPARRAFGDARCSTKSGKPLWCWPSLRTPAAAADPLRCPGSTSTFEADHPAEIAEPGASIRQSRSHLHLGRSPWHAPDRFVPSRNQS